MSRKSAVHAIQQQINKSVTGGSSLQIGEQLRFASLNASHALEQIIGHENGLSIDVHGIKETILDVVNDNLLTNAGLELDEAVKDFPDEWNFTENPYVTRGLDSAKVHYGNKSFRISGTNPTDSDITVYLSQTVYANYVDFGYYSLSFYLFDYGEPEFQYFAEVVPYSAMHVNLGSIQLEAPQSGTLNTLYGFARWYETLQLPEGVDYVIVRIGVTIPANTTTPIEAWIDYPCFNPGLVVHRPGELVEGILRTSHISTEGLDAKVLKSGQITITEWLKLATEAGDVRLYLNEEMGGNVLEFLRPLGEEDEFQSVITLGKYGINPNDYGLKAGGTTLSDSGIRIRQGDIALGPEDNPLFSVSEEGYLTSVAGKIANFTIERNRLSSGSIFLDSAFELIGVQNGVTPDVVIGKYEEGKYGLKAGGTTLNKDGIDITSGRIRLGIGPDDIPLFSVNNDGYMVAKSGTIADFTIHSHLLQSNNANLILNSANSTITLANVVDHPDYATIIQPGGIFGKAPIATLPHFDPTEASPQYYININKLYFGEITCKNNVDYSYNRLTGEVVKLKTAQPSMPNTVTVEYIIVDYRENPNGEYSTFTEEITFEVKQRAAAIVTDDSLIDATFVKNLIIGTAEIGYASINTAHIQEIHGSKIIAGTIDATHLEIGRAGNLIPNSTFISKEFYLDWIDLMLGSPNAPYNLLGDNFLWQEEEYLYDGASVSQSSSDQGIVYMGLDIQIGVILKPNTSYTFSAYQKLVVPQGESLTGYNLQVLGDAIDIEETSNPISDNFLDTETHDWKRKAVKFRTGSSGYVRLLSTLREPSSNKVIGYVDAFMLEEGPVESDFYKTGITRIRGGNIETNSITLSQLNFTPVESKNVIASINASEEEGLVIGSDKLAITSEVYGLATELRFESGRIASRVGKKTSFKPRKTTLFRFDEKLTSTDGVVAEIIG